MIKVGDILVSKQTFRMSTVVVNKDDVLYVVHVYDENHANYVAQLLHPTQGLLIWYRYWSNWKEYFDIQ